MIDTLKLASRLSAAGMDRQQAEVLADELNAQLAAATATKADVDALEQRLGAHMDALFWRTMAGVALLLVGHLAAVWGIVAAHTGP